MNKKTLIKTLTSSVLLAGFLLLAYGSKDDKKSDNSQTTTEKEIEADCLRCDGTGVETQYGIGGNATGHKTCPSCKGTGKWE